MLAVGAFQTRVCAVFIAPQRTHLVEEKEVLAVAHPIGCSCCRFHHDEGWSSRSHPVFDDRPNEVWPENRDNHREFALIHDPQFLTTLMHSTVFPRMGLRDRLQPHIIPSLWHIIRFGVHQFYVFAVDHKLWSPFAEHRETSGYKPQAKYCRTCHECCQWWLSTQLVLLIWSRRLYIWSIWSCFLCIRHTWNQSSYIYTDLTACEGSFLHIHEHKVLVSWRGDKHG